MDSYLLPEFVHLTGAHVLACVCTSGALVEELASEWCLIVINKYIISIKITIQHIAAMCVGIYVVKVTT